MMANSAKIISNSKLLRYDKYFPPFPTTDSNNAPVIFVSIEKDNHKVCFENKFYALAYIEGYDFMLLCYKEYILEF